MALFAALFAAALIDARTRRIPNGLTAALGAAGLGFATLGLSAVSVPMAVVGGAVGLALMTPGYLFGATGGGDVKLMAAVGAVVGPSTVVTAFLFTAVAGGVLAVMVASRRGRLAATLAGTARLADPRSEGERPSAALSARTFAYGPAIAVGSALAVLLK